MQYLFVVYFLLTTYLARLFLSLSLLARSKRNTRNACRLVLMFTFFTFGTNPYFPTIVPSRSVASRSTRSQSPANNPCTPLSHSSVARDRHDSEAYRYPDAAGAIPQARLLRSPLESTSRSCAVPTWQV